MPMSALGPLPGMAAQRGATWRHAGHGAGNNAGKTMSIISRASSDGVTRVPHLTGLDVSRWRRGTTVTDGRTDARLRG